MADAKIIYAAAIDLELNERTTAIVVQEAYYNVEHRDESFAERVRMDPFGLPKSTFQWPVALQVQDAYASGEAANGNGAANVSDAQILSAVQANWPLDL